VWINKRLSNVLTCLCPKKENVEAYAKSPIPLELLGHIKQAEMKGWFEKIEVWYDDRDPDPVLIGTARKEQYLIGRWGAEAVTLERLDALAVTKKKADLERKAKAKISEIQEGLAQLEENTQKILDGEYSTFKYL
jgi:hypothetical protein